MANLNVSKRFPAWLRRLGWLSFAMLGLITVLLVARWWLMERSHQTATEFVKQGTLPKNSSKNGASGGVPSSAQTEADLPRGVPVTELEMVGVYMGADSQERRELENKLAEIRDFLKIAMLRESRVDGVLRFRTLLAKMGIDVPEAMTEAEAATEFLKQANRFSGLLTQWKEAVGKGAWDSSSADVSRKNGQIGFLALGFQNLLGTMAEAHMRTGDAGAAWSDWKTMGLSADRCVDSRSIAAGMLASSIRSRMFQTARAGMELGAWDEDQLAQISKTLSGENALDSMRRDVDAEKISVADYFARLRENDSVLTAPLLNTNSPVESFINRIGVSLTTDQQIEDNLSVVIQRMNQPFDRFDPGTGIYLPPSADEISESAESDHSGISFDRFYFMYADMCGGPGSFNYIPEKIIKSQSAVDQSRIAAALEMQQRATGAYPETLDAVSGTFGGSMPVDIATGKPYFYQRDAGGGYTMWSTGIDGRNDGGNEKTDVTWKHRPQNSK